MEERDYALEMLNHVEDRIADSVVRVQMGAVLRSTAAPSFASMNFLRVTDDSPINAGPEAFGTLIRKTAQEHGVKAIVIDRHEVARQINPFIEVDDGGGYWFRTARFLYASRTEPEVPQHKAEALTADEFVESRIAFLVADPDYDATQAGEEEAIARVVSDRLDSIRLGVRVEGRIVAAGEAYIHDKTAQLESLAVHPEFRRKGYGKAVVAARVRAALNRGCDLVFAQIEGSEKPSLLLHEDMEFEQIGIRQTFEWSDSE